MADKFCSKKNIQFLLHNVFDAGSLNQVERFADHNAKAMDMVIDEALRMAKKLFYSIAFEMDKEQPRMEDGRVKVHPQVRNIMKECGEGGWIAATFDNEHGGDQMPMTVSGATQFIFSAANYSANVFPELTTGAAHLITSFGSQELIDTYVPNMLAGKWQGTMALTEPQAGSSLTDLTTEATPTDEGYYNISGRKIFISCGDHDGADNVVHLMLARIADAPLGIKGISLFVVPRMRPEGGNLVYNDLAVSQIYHKLGYRGSPITELAIGEKGDCRGWLVGEPHKGLKYMFQLMNEARLSVGIGAAGIATAAYYASLDYAKSRPQGRRLMEKDPTKPQIPIIEHPDVKRMLLFQKAVVEGSLSLIIQCCNLEDRKRGLTGEEAENAELLLEILTPIVKTYPSEMGILSTSAAIQCLGGYGYCDDFPVEQYYRDVRIHPIHEGTTAIQGMDLLGRKVVMKEGKAMMLYADALKKTIQEAGEFPELKAHADDLGAAADRLQEVIMHLIGVAQAEGPEAFLSDATLFLEMFGHITIAWQWLLQGVAVQKALADGPKKADQDFLAGKLHALRFFFAYELPKIQGLATRLTNPERVTMEMQTSFFND